MNLLEEILMRAQLPPAQPFPGWTPPVPEDPNVARMPRMSDIPQMLLPPHMRNTTGAPDASQPGLQMAVGNAPAGPDIPAQFRVHAGMLPEMGVDRPAFMTPAEREMQALVNPDARNAERVPTPMERPAAAPPREADGSARDDGGLPHNPSMFATPPTDMSSRGRGSPGIVPAAASSRAAPIAPTPEQLQTGQDGGFFGRLGGFGDAIMGGLKNNSNTLLALGAGFAGAPNIGQGISRAAAAAIPASQQDLKNRTSLQGQGALYRTLVDAGVPQQQALAAMTNPELAKRLMEGYVSDRKHELKTIKSKDAFGNEVERVVAVNPFDLSYKEIGGGGGAGPGGGGAAVPPGIQDQGFFAPGITNVDESLQGDAYLAQFSPRVQAAARSYIKGDSMPTGRQDWTQKIKTIAQKYGEDVGLAVSDGEYFKRKKFNTDLGSVNPNSVGGQVKAFRQGISHFKSLAEAIEKYQPSSGLGIEKVAQGMNYIRNQKSSNADISAQINAAAQSLAGEVGKLFSGSTGGGVHERELTRNRFNSINSGPASAGALESTLELMEGGLSSIERQRDEVLGAGRGPKFIDEKTHKEIEEIREIVKRLRSGEAKPAAGAPARSTAPAPGKYIYDPATGSMRPVQ